LNIIQTPNWRDCEESQEGRQTQEWAGVGTSLNFHDGPRLPDPSGPFAVVLFKGCSKPVRIMLDPFAWTDTGGYYCTKYQQKDGKIYGIQAVGISGAMPKF